MLDYDNEILKKLKIFQLNEIILELRKLVRELIQRNRILEKENFKLKELLGTKVEPERVKELEEQLRVLKEREELVKKKIKRLVVKLEKLELLDQEADEEPGLDMNEELKD